MNSLVLDANVLIAYFKKTDTHHNQARKIIADADDLEINEVTMAEVLVGPARIGDEQDVLDDSQSEVGIKVAETTADYVLTLSRVRARHRLKMPDAIVLATALDIHADLSTFDVELRIAAKAEGVPVR